MPQQSRFVYISSRATCDPVKTVIVFPPSDRSKTIDDAAEFARESGWIDEVENDAAVLMVAVAGEGWSSCPDDMPMRLYQENRRSFLAPSSGIQGRGGLLWAWETLIYLVGYGDGAIFAGSYQLSCPGFAAASVLVDGAPTCLDALDGPSSHWLVANPDDYALRNRDIPITVWFMGRSDHGAMFDHARRVDGAVKTREVICADALTRIFENPINSGMQVRETSGLTGAAPEIASEGMEFFSRVIRWKNGPDGTLALRRTKAEFYSDGRYLHHEVTCSGGSYHYAVYLPEGCSRADVRNLPLVLSLHGRGEPTWIFAAKNGWEELADETGDFAVLLPDSPGNVWSYDRDAQALELVVGQAIAEYGFDPTRVYITGFSNGAVFTCQMATSAPGYFAAASPWNGPSVDAIRSSGLGDFIFAPEFEGAGVEMPFWIAAGDSDDKAGTLSSAEVDIILAANGCERACGIHLDSGKTYGEKAGYSEGGRFSTDLFFNGEKSPRVALTLMKDMPHGAIADEARASWEFMKQFRRPKGSGRVEVI